MKTALRLAFATALVLVLGCAVAATLWWFFGSHEGVTLVIDDEMIVGPAWDGPEGLLALGGVLIALVVVVVVVPLALLIGLGVPAVLGGLALALGLLVLAAVLAALCAPLLLPVLLVVWLVRRDRRAAGRASSTTIAA